MSKGVAVDRAIHKVGLLGRLVEPHAEVRAPHERRQARFLATVLLILPLVALAGVIVQVSAQPDLLLPGLEDLPSFLIGFAGYVVARTRRWRAAVPLVMAIVVVDTILAVLAAPGNPIHYVYLVIPVLLGSVFLGRRGMIVTSLLVEGLALGLAVTQIRALGLPDFLAAMVALVVLQSVVILTSLHRFGVEQDRRQDLAARESLARGLLEASFGGLAVVRDGAIRETNRGFADIFGGRADDLVDMPIDRLLPEPVLAGDGAEAGPRELLGRRLDGSFVPVAVVARANDELLQDDQVVAVQDLSDREAQRARTHQADRLASMGRIAAGVAHEINNPLTWIVGNLERILPEVDSDARKLVDQAIDGARRVQQITLDLGTFAREREGPVVGLDLTDVVRSSLNMVRHDIEHVATLEEVYGSAPPVDADPTRIGQVCLNLLLNAAQAVTEGGGTCVRVEVGTTPEGWAFVEVRDDGPGIPEEIQARVFEPFFTTRPEGTGLGLAISRSLIVDLDGEMVLESAPGRGTSIGFRLPAGELPTGPEEPPSSERSTKVDGAETSARILVIDDEPAICELLQAALARHEVHVATNGEEGRRLALEEPWDLVLCDLMMPAVNGMEIHAALAATVPGRERCLVFLTGGAFTPKARDFLDAVDNPVLHKPFRLAAVRDLVARLLEAA